MDNNILSVVGLTVSFDGFVVLDSLDFSLSRGELRFLIGPNGAGKTTLLDLITGKSKPTGGKIVFDGDTDLTKLREHDLVKLGIGRKFQTPSVFSSLTVYENMEVAVGFRRRWDALLRPVQKSEAEWIETILEKVGLGNHRTPRRGLFPTEKSSGWKLVCCWLRNRSCCCWTSRWPG